MDENIIDLSSVKKHLSDKQLAALFEQYVKQTTLLLLNSGYDIKDPIITYFLQSSSMMMLGAVTISEKKDS